MTRCCISLFWKQKRYTISSKRSQEGGEKVFTVFGSAAAESGGLLGNPLVLFLLVLLSIYIFIKFCSWAKKFQLTAGFKKAIYILTGAGLIVFNILYAKGNALILETGDWSGATTALLASFVWVFIFAFALMAQTKSE